MAGGLVAAAVLVVVGYLIGHQHGSSSSSASAGAGAARGVVYVESNIAQPETRTAFSRWDGSGGQSHPVDIAEYPTGGAARPT